MGNGISIWRKNSDNIIAHINVNRGLTVYYGVKLSCQELDEIEQYRNTADPEISYTQTEKVFVERPKEEA